MQSRGASLLEAVTNQAIALGIAVAAGFVIFPALGVQITAAQSIGANLAFAGVSIARSYVVRRVFARL